MWETFKNLFGIVKKDVSSTIDVIIPTSSKPNWEDYSKEMSTKDALVGTGKVVVGLATGQYTSMADNYKATGDPFTQTNGANNVNTTLSNNVAGNSGIAGALIIFGIVLMLVRR